MVSCAHVSRLCALSDSAFSSIYLWSDRCRRFASRLAPARLAAREMLYGLFPYFGKSLDGVFRVEADSFGPFHQLNHFDQLLSGLDVADVVLPALEPLREIDLAQAGLLALFDKEFAQRLMSWRIGGASHPSVLNGLFEYGKFPYFRIRNMKPGPPTSTESSRKRERLRVFSRLINFGLL